MNRLRQYFFNNQQLLILCHGATSAYDKRVFSSFESKINDYILAEDGALSVVIALMGKNITKVEDSLVFYRASASSLTSGTNQERVLVGIKEDEQCIERLAYSQANRCTLFLRLNNRLQKNGKEQLNRRLLETDFVRLNTRARWSSIGIVDRVQYIFSKNCTPEDYKWALPRLFSISIFILMKTAYRKLKFFMRASNI